MARHNDFRIAKSGGMGLKPEATGGQRRAPIQPDKNPQRQKNKGKRHKYTPKKMQDGHANPLLLTHGYKDTPNREVTLTRFS